VALAHQPGSPESESPTVSGFTEGFERLLTNVTRVVVAPEHTVGHPTPACVKRLWSGPSFLDGWLSGRMGMAAK
jgi:hypothetical protein